MRPPSRRTALRAVALALAGGMVAVGAGAARTQTSLDAAGAWLAYGRTPDVQNASPAPVTPAAAKAFHTVWSTAVGGLVTAQPLYAPAVPVGGRVRSLIVVASGSNVVTALDARNGSVVWRRSLGPTAPQVCGGQGGIESTPVIDPASRRVYVIGADGVLRALALATGKPVAGWSVPIIERTNVETVWSALRISGRTLYVPVASWCDKGDAQGAWDGRLVAVDLPSRRITRTFDVVPGPDNGGSIWGPGGVSIDPADGSIWTATANATVEEAGNVVEDKPHAERVLRLSPAFRVLAEVLEPDSNPVVLGDQGFGATPMLFQPSGCPALLAVNSKDAYTYVWKRADLKAPPPLRRKLGQATSDATFYAQPIWLPATRTLVVDGAALPNGGGAKGAVAFHVSPGCRFSVAWTLNIGGGVAPQPLAAGQVAFVPATAVAKLYAVDTASGTIVNSFDTKQAAYTAPMMAAGRVVVASSDGTVFAFGAK